MARNPKSLFTYLLSVVLLAGVYFGTAKLGLSFSPVSGFATVVWPPTGIALAALWLFGKRLWPGVFIGAFLVNLHTGAPLLVAIGMALGNTLEAIVGVYLLKRSGFHSSLSTVRDVVLLIALAALVSTLVSATIGTLSLLLGGVIPAGAITKTWTAWWVGDMLGNLIIAPLIFAWVSQKPIHFRSKQFLESAVVGALFLAATVLIFANDFTTGIKPISFAYLLFPFLILAALRYRMRYVITLIFLLSVLAVWNTSRGHGPFAIGTITEDLTSLQLFMGVTSATFLSLAVIMFERKQALEAVATLNKKLTNKVAAKTAELHHEKELDKLKDEFVAIASHELKTPLTSMKAYAQILEKSLTQSQETEAAHMAGRINIQADKLTRLANELLDVSNIESGKFVPKKKKFNLNELVDKAIVDFQYTVPAHTITTKGTIRKRITGDPDRIEQVILNLLSNAVKYSPKARKVIVTVASDKDFATVSVQDFGSGINKYDLKKIFRRFYRTADNTRGKQAVSGIGLGLFISAKIIKQHGGKIWAESNPGEGSTFRFTLPLNG